MPILPSLVAPVAFFQNCPPYLGMEPYFGFHFSPPFLFSSVLRNRNDSFPVSMMCAWSVSRSSIALQSLALGNIVVHSENGRFVVIITAARSTLRGDRLAIQDSMLLPRRGPRHDQFHCSVIVPLDFQIRDPAVSLGGRDPTVSEKILHNDQVRIGIEQLRRHCVPKLMARGFKP